MSIRKILSISLVLLLTGAMPTAAAQVEADRILRYATKHYDLWIDGSVREAEETGLILEQAWTFFDAFFHAHPNETKRLRIKLLGNENAFLDTAWGDGASIPPQCRPACWSPETGTLYAYGSPAEYAMRRVLLFGAALQFHAMSRAKNKDLPREWHEAGLAQLMSRHTWDGEKLQLMARPRVECIDFPARALAMIEAQPDKLPGLSDVDAPDPLACWSVVGLCLQGGDGRHRAAFEKLALGASGSKMPGVDFLRSLGKPEVLAREMRAWVESQQTPFECATERWEDRGATGIVGTAGWGSFGFCVLRDPRASTIGCTLGELPKRGGRAGLVTGYYGRLDYTLITVVAPTLRIETWHDGLRVKAEEVPLPGDHVKRRKLKLVRKGAQVSIEVDGVVLTTKELPGGRNGFFVQDATVTFTEVSWE